MMSALDKWIRTGIRKQEWFTFWHSDYGSYTYKFTNTHKSITII